MRGISCWSRERTHLPLEGAETMCDELIITCISHLPAPLGEKRQRIGSKSWSWMEEGPMEDVFKI